MFLDIGIGIVLSFFVSWLFNIDLETYFIVAGIAFTLLPDIDVLLEIIMFRDPKILKGGFESKFHREWFHYPLLYIPFVAVVYVVGGSPWATLLALGLLFHFLHDSVGPAWGLKWRAPFSWNNYKFFSEKDGVPSGRFLVRWTPEELAEVLKKYHNPYWFHDQYLRLNFILVVEILVLAASLVILLYAR